MTETNILLFMTLCIGIVGISMIGASIALRNSIRKKKRNCTIPVKAVTSDEEQDKDKKETDTAKDKEKAA